MDEIRKFSENHKNIIVVILLAVLTLIPVIILDIDKHPKLWYFISWLFWVITLIIQRVDSVNFTLNRIWLWFWDTPVSWTMGGEFSGNFETEDFKEVVEKILKLYPESKLWHQSTDEAIIKLPKVGGNIRLFVTSTQSDYSDFNEVFVFELSDLYVPFRQSEKSLNFMISLIENTIKPSISIQREKYTLKVKFGDTNPYFGLFIKRFKVPNQDLITFRVQYKETEELSQGNIDVSAEKLSLITNNLLSLKMFSHKYITLSSLNLVQT